MRRISIWIGFSYACVFVYTHPRRHIVCGTNTHAPLNFPSSYVSFACRISASVRCSLFFNMYEMEIMTKSLKYYNDVIKRNSSLQYKKLYHQTCLNRINLIFDAVKIQKIRISHMIWTNLMKKTNQIFFNTYKENFYFSTRIDLVYKENFLFGQDKLRTMQ